MVCGAGGLRELAALDLIEVSLVANPVQGLARVHAVENRTASCIKRCMIILIQPFVR